MSLLAWTYAVWATLALALHWCMFCLGARRSGRRGGITAAAENLRMYNPFSWPGCVRARMENLRGFICEHGRRHETLGLITRADLNDSAKRDRIAREAFVSWPSFWAEAVWQYTKTVMLTGIVGVVVLAVFLRF